MDADILLGYQVMGMPSHWPRIMHADIHSYLTLDTSRLKKAGSKEE
jgi:hypothetical protein